MNLQLIFCPFPFCDHEGWQLGMNTTRGCREELGLREGALPMQKHVQSMRSAMDLSLYGVSVSLDGMY